MKIISHFNLLYLTFIGLQIIIHSIRLTSFRDSSKILNYCQLWTVSLWQEESVLNPNKR